MKTVLSIVGTRPDSIKMAPVILELRNSPDIKSVVYSSGQHREMLRQVLDTFQITVDGDFEVMKESQTLAYLTASVLSAMDGAIEQVQPDLVVAQGDTTTTFVAALSAFYRQVPFAHVEAGLRTETIASPFPEEFNRRAAALITRLHFAPTHLAAKALLSEGVPDDHVFVTGNTSIDAILDVASRSESGDLKKGRMLLVTTHRRENWGDRQRHIARALRTVLDQSPDTYAVLPMHRNPVVRKVLEEELGGDPRVSLIEPPGYSEFANLMREAHLILTDSGGVQEEAPALGKPVLVLRSETERPEGITAGNAILVGTDELEIVKQATRLLSDAAAYAAIAQTRNPYGDGFAAKRIVAQIRRFLDLSFDDIAEFAG